MGFVLIELIEKDGSKSITLVPESWVFNNEKSVMWPTTRNVDKYRSDPDSRPNSNWEIFTCSVRRKNIADFAEGRRLEKIYEDLDTTADELKYKYLYILLLLLF